MSYEDAVNEYLALISSRVAEPFASSTNIVQLLKTKGVKVFVPNNWDGINNIEPLQLHWLPGLPSSMKPVNPKPDLLTRSYMNTRRKSSNV
eukprot:scaffold9152_cov302-Ochromonas_danica.AAC.1